MPGPLQISNPNNVHTNISGYLSVHLMETTANTLWKRDIL